MSRVTQLEAALASEQAYSRRLRDEATMLREVIGRLRPTHLAIVDPTTGARVICASLAPPEYWAALHPSDPTTPPPCDCGAAAGQAIADAVLTDRLPTRWSLGLGAAPVAVDRA